MTYDDNALKKWRNAAIAAIITTGALVGLHVHDRIKHNRIPKEDLIQERYIPQSRLEIECRDLDGNGESEIIMRVGDRLYQLREVEGKPVISAYTPAEVF